MITRVYALTGVALSMTMLAACSKGEDAPAVAATEASAVASGASDAASTAASGAADAGGAVSPLPANGNEAVNMDANTNDGGQSPASNSFTEGQARGHIENAGYSDVSNLTKTADGMWVGKAMKGGKSVNVSVDFKGAVSTK